MLRFRHAHQAGDGHALVLTIAPQRMEAGAIAGIPYPDQSIVATVRVNVKVAVGGPCISHKSE